MSDYLFPPPPVPAVAIRGRSTLFPVRRIFCVGRNYAAHAREMGRDPDREPPFFFMKPADTLQPDGAILPYPPQTANLHYEMELVVAIGRDGVEIPVEQALEHVFGYACGLDMTRRDLQLAARDAGRPWDWGKGFDASAPCAPLVPVEAIGHPSRGAIRLKVNGAVKQEADLADLIWPVPDIVAICSRSMALKAGDLIYTGTPAGVGPVVPGDKLEGEIEGVGTIHVSIGPGGGRG